MCKAVAKTAGSLMEAIEPEFVELLTVTDLASTPDGQAAITAYQDAEKVVIAWVPGTSAQEAIEVLNDFTTVFNKLPLPADVKTLESLVSAGVVGIIGVLTANSPAPEAAEAATPEETEAIQSVHAHTVAVETQAKVTAISGYTPSRWDMARVALGDKAAISGKWKSEWRKAAQAAAQVNPKYAALVC